MSLVLTRYPIENIFIAHTQTIVKILVEHLKFNLEKKNTLPSSQNQSPSPKENIIFIDSQLMDHEPQWEELADDDMDDLLNESKFEEQNRDSENDEQQQTNNPVSMGSMMASISEVTLNNLYLGDLQQQTDDIKI
jgi:hypothetical protein